MELPFEGFMRHIPANAVARGLLHFVNGFGREPKWNRFMLALLPGQRQIDGGDYATAVKTLEQAVRLDPSNSAALAGLRKAQQAKRTEDEILQRRK